MDACRSHTRLSVMVAFQKENEMSLSGGSQEFCTATDFHHGTKLELKHSVIPLLLLCFYYSCDWVSFLIMTSRLKYGPHCTV